MLKTELSADDLHPTAAGYAIMAPLAQAAIDKALSTPSRPDPDVHMDNLCHTLVGAAIGEAGLKIRTRFGNPALMIAANLPDLDVLVFATGARRVRSGAAGRTACWRRRCCRLP